MNTKQVLVDFGAMNKDFKILNLNLFRQLVTEIADMSERLYDVKGRPWVEDDTFNSNRALANVPVLNAIDDARKNMGIYESQEKLVVYKPTTADEVVIEENDELKPGTQLSLFTMEQLDQMILDGEIKMVDDETGEPCLAHGANFGFTPGSKWEVIKEFKGKSHDAGGIDIVVGNGTIKMTGKDGDIKAENGLVISKSSLNFE